MIVSFTAGCTSAARENLRSFPTADEWKAAAAHALRDGDTWAPAGAAVMVAATGADDDIAAWAVDETPIFGSVRGAADASDFMKYTTHAIMIGSALATAREENRRRERLLRGLEQELMIIQVRGVIEVLKDTVERERPDGSNRLSFPSGDAALAAAYGALTRHNLQKTTLSPRWKRSVSAGSRVFVGVIAWSRVEAGQHYPTDAFAGAALGNFIAEFLQHLAYGEERIDVSFVPSRDGASFLVSLRY